MNKQEKWKKARERYMAKLRSCPERLKKYRERHREKVKAWKIKRPQIHEAWWRNFRQSQREIVIRAKSKSCADCGIQYNHWIMQFDHRDPSLKSFTIGSEGLYRKGKRTLINEIAKCDVVCANCHADRTYRSRTLSQPSVVPTIHFSETLT